MSGSTATHMTTRHIVVGWWMGQRIGNPSFVHLYDRPVKVPRLACCGEQHANGERRSALMPLLHVPLLHPPS